MTRDVIVTSCSFQGWKAYGERCVKSFDNYWPGGIRLIVVSEDSLAPTLVSSRREISFWNLLEHRPAAQFLTAFAPYKWAQGEGDASRVGDYEITSKYPARPGYNFRFDAYKFAKKVFAIEMVCRQYLAKYDRLFWLDADTITHASVPTNLLDKMLPSGYGISCLQRPNYHSECGFVGYNLQWADVRAFIQCFAAMYTTGRVFSLDEWHDSWVFDWLRDGFEGLRTYAIPHKSNHHPFINSELGKYMDHLKGRRKRAGRSAAAEQRAHRGMGGYWGRR